MFTNLLIVVAAGLLSVVISPALGLVLMSFWHRPLHAMTDAFTTTGTILKEGAGIMPGGCGCPRR
jgi:hypothetical protein